MATVRVMDPRSGQAVWTGTSAGATRSSPVFANGSLYVATDAGTVDAFASRVNRPPAAPAPRRGALIADAGEPVLRWSQVADPDGEALTTVVRLDQNGEVLEGFEHELRVEANATEVALPPSLRPGVVYTYAVRSRDGRGAPSPWSEAGTVKVVVSVLIVGRTRDLLRTLSGRRFPPAEHTDRAAGVGLIVCGVT